MRLKVTYYMLYTVYHLQVCLSVITVFHQPLFLMLISVFCMIVSSLFLVKHLVHGFLQVLKFPL